MSDLSEGILFGLGNPLLDISANVDGEFLNQYGFKPNDAILAEEKHQTLYDDMVARYQVKYTAGGATQNTMRVAQWIIGVPNRTTFMGCIGNDEFGRMMEKNAKDDGVNVIYMKDETPTGKCACLITENGKHRSLCAFLGASQNFKKDHLMAHFDYVKKAKVFYVSGFHLAVSPESIMELATHAHSNDGKIFCMNLSAPYISHVFTQPLLNVFPYIDILFGNDTEAEAFAQMKGWTVITKIKDQSSEFSRGGM